MTEPKLTDTQALALATVKEIRLTKNQVALVDEWNYELLNQYKWQAHWDKGTQSYYAVRTEYKPIKKSIRMHNVIANTPKGMHCDHINHLTLDNRESNLRNITPSQNQMNRRGPNANGSLAERCVTRHGNGFQVQVNKGGKRVFCKSYKTIEEAKAARDSAIRRYHGKFATLGE